MFTVNVWNPINEMYKSRGWKKKKSNQKPPQLYQVDTAAIDTVPGIA